jgi:ribonucleoside-triphosphate reductase
MLDKKRFADIRCANEAGFAAGQAPYYTNSSQLPVGHTDDLFETLRLQDELQTKYTGGTVLHVFLGEQVRDAGAVRALVRKIAENYRLPYFTLTPTFSICPTHGYLDGEHHRCGRCRESTEVYSRVVGYLRPVKQWHAGKPAELEERRNLRIASA